MEFLRGKYDVDTLYLYTIFRNMTRDEQRRVVETPFPALWTALWGNGRDTHSQEYTDAKEKFESLDRAQLVANNPSVFEEPEWGIPKGRRMRKETDADCAVREFFEETNIPRDAYTLCQNLQFSETFQGTNGLMYRHNYFIALLVDTAWVDVNPILTYVQKREISQVAWKSLDECRSIIRPYYEDRRTLYTDVERAIQTFETLG
jgi:8-oxo-dGTP pyrophosphatase MutT (NUDIX family)